MATIPTYTTWVDGQVVTADDLNTQLRDAGNFHKALPMVYLRASATQSIANNSDVALNFDTEDVKVDLTHSVVSNTSRIVCVTPGLYRLAGSIGWASNATGARSARWFLNGGAVSYVIQQPAAATGNLGCPAPTILLRLAAGDYVELMARQSSGAALNANPGSPTNSQVLVEWVAV